MRKVMGIVLFFISLCAQAQVQEGCFPLTQTVSGPVTLTMWCQVVEYSGASPLAPQHTTEFLTLGRGVSSTNLHIQLDNWYSAMDATLQLEFLHSSSDIVTVPFLLHYDGLNTLVADFPLSLSLNAGDRVRVIQQAFIPHPCGLADNCGLHALLTFQ